MLGAPLSRPSVTLQPTPLWSIGSLPHAASRRLAPEPVAHLRQAPRPGQSSVPPLTTPRQVRTNRSCIRRPPDRGRVLAAFPIPSPQAETRSSRPPPAPCCTRRRHPRRKDKATPSRPAHEPWYLVVGVIARQHEHHVSEPNLRVNDPARVVILSSDGVEASSVNHRNAPGASR